MQTILRVLIGVFFGLSTVSAVGKDAAVLDVELSKEFCRKLVLEHTPSKDVRYVAGVDALGASVVPADLNPSGIYAPKNIRIPVILNKNFSGDYFTYDTGFQVNNPYVAEVPLDYVDYNLETGDIKYQGRSLGNKAARLLKSQCRRVLKE